MRRVVVVGAGVIGLLCAYEVRRRGAAVTLIDKGRPGAGCSWANNGWVVPSYSAPLPAPGLVRTSLAWMLRPGSPLYIRPRPDPDLVRWLWAFRRRCNPCDYEAGLRAVADANRRTLDLFDGLRSDGVEFEIHRSRALFLFLTRPAREAVLEDLERLTVHGYPGPQRIDAAEVREMLPQVRPEVLGGILAPEERHVRPETLVAGLVGRLRAMGVEIREGIEALGLLRRGDSVTALRTSREDIEGDQFLLAAGAWSAALGRRLGLSLPIQAGKGYSITIADPGMEFPGPVYLDEARVAISPFTGALRIGGTMELSGVNTTLDPRRLDAIRAGARRYLHRWPAGSAEEEWVGMRPLTPDGLPVIGRIPAYDNLYVATGHGMYGVTLAPATAAALAALTSGDPPPFDIAPFRPERFHQSKPTGSAGTTRRTIDG